MIVLLAYVCYNFMLAILFIFAKRGVRNEKTRKVLALVLSLVLSLSALILPVSADDAYDGSLRVMAYNVSGIPILGSFQGTKVTSGAKKARILGEHLNKLDLDIIGTQEDFNSHSHLAKQMTAFPYKTFSSGGPPLGDGLNIFSKFPIYNIERTTWNVRHGILSDYSDQLTRKGFVRSLVQIEQGVFIDLYVLHAEAGGDALSIAARADDYRQLAEDINSRGDRAALVIGDFNSRLGGNGAGDIYENLMAAAGLFDTWAELYNEGKYIYGDGSDWNPSMGESIDKVLYKNGGGIKFKPEILEYYIVTDSKGETYTDHHATIAEINYCINELVPNTETLKEPEDYNKPERLIERIKEFFKILKLIFSDLGNLSNLLS